MGTPNKLTQDLQSYIHGVGVRESPVARRCREETAEDFPDQKQMQIAPEQAGFLALLVRILDARQVLEIGSFTGYSALAMAAALPASGRIVALDVSERFTARAREYWEEAGVDDRIELRLGPARESLADLAREGATGRFDLAFIDADKVNYDFYYERSLELVRAGGLVTIDNTLWDGRVIDPDDHSEDTEAIRALNLKIHGDARVDAVLTTVGDGLTLARIRQGG